MGCHGDYKNQGVEGGGSWEIKKTKQTTSEMRIKNQPKAPETYRKFVVTI